MMTFWAIKNNTYSLIKMYVGHFLAHFSKNFGYFYNICKQIL